MPLHGFCFCILRAEVYRAGDDILGLLVRPLPFCISLSSTTRYFSDASLPQRMPHEVHKLLTGHVRVLQLGAAGVIWGNVGADVLGMKNLACILCHFRIYFLRFAAV